MADALGCVCPADGGSTPAPVAPAAASVAPAAATVASAKPLRSFLAARSKLNPVEWSNDVNHESLLHVPANAKPQRTGVQPTPSGKPTQTPKPSGKPTPTPKPSGKPTPTPKPSGKPTPTPAANPKLKSTGKPTATTKLSSVVRDALKTKYCPVCADPAVTCKETAEKQQDICNDWHWKVTANGHKAGDYAPLATKAECDAWKTPAAFTFSAGVKLRTAIDIDFGPIPLKQMTASLDVIASAGTGVNGNPKLSVSGDVVKKFTLNKQWGTYLYLNLTQVSFMFGATDVIDMSTYSAVVEAKGNLTLKIPKLPALTIDTVSAGWADQALFISVASKRAVTWGSFSLIDSKIAATLSSDQLAVAIGGKVEITDLGKKVATLLKLNEAGAGVVKKILNSVLGTKSLNKIKKEFSLKYSTLKVSLPGQSAADAGKKAEAERVARVKAQEEKLKQALLLKLAAAPKSKLQQAMEDKLKAQAKAEAELAVPEPPQSKFQKMRDDVKAKLMSSAKDGFTLTVAELKSEDVDNWKILPFKMPPNWAIKLEANIALPMKFSVAGKLMKTGGKVATLLPPQLPGLGLKSLDDPTLHWGVGFKSIGIDFTYETAKATVKLELELSFRFGQPFGASPAPAVAHSDVGVAGKMEISFLGPPTGTLGLRTTNAWNDMLGIQGLHLHSLGGSATVGTVAPWINGVSLFLDVQFRSFVFKAWMVITFPDPMVNGLCLGVQMKNLDLGAVISTVAKLVSLPLPEGFNFKIPEFSISFAVPSAAKPDLPGGFDCSPGARAKFVDVPLLGLGLFNMEFATELMPPKILLQGKIVMKPENIINIANSASDWITGNVFGDKAKGLINKICKEKCKEVIQNLFPIESLEMTKLELAVIPKPTMTLPDFIIEIKPDTWLAKLLKRTRIEIKVGTFLTEMLKKAKDALVVILKKLWEDVIKPLGKKVFDALSEILKKFKLFDFAMKVVGKLKSALNWLKSKFTFVQMVEASGDMELRAEVDTNKDGALSQEELTAGAETFALCKELAVEIQHRRAEMDTEAGLKAFMESTQYMSNMVESFQGVGITTEMQQRAVANLNLRVLQLNHYVWEQRAKDPAFAVHFGSSSAAESDVLLARAVAEAQTAQTTAAALVKVEDSDSVKHATVSEAVDYMEEAEEPEEA